MKRVIKKVLSIVLCFVMFFGIAPLNGFIGLNFPKLKIRFSDMNLPKISDIFALQASAATSGTCGDNLTWEIDDNGILTISGNGSMYDYGYDYYNLAPWLHFEDRIKTVNILDGVTSIGNCAFYGCSTLISIVIPDSVKTIGYEAFYHCICLENIKIPNGVSCIEDSAFLGCSKLTSITLPNSVESISMYAFYGCHSLSCLTIPNSVKYIGEGAFQFCTGFTNITIPDSVTTINSGAFYMVNNISFSENMKAVGYNVDDCTIVDYYPWGAKCVNGYVDELFVYSDSSKTKLCGCSSLASGSVTIPEDVTSIGSSAFSSCENLTNITIPDSVTSIGWGAFSYCSSLESITIPKRVTTINDYTFDNCKSLTNVIISEGVTSIGSNAFSGCDSITNISIPSTVTHIKYAVFSVYNNPVLDIYYNGKESDWGSIEIEGFNNSLTNAVEDVYYDESMNCSKIHFVRDFSISYYVNNALYCVQNYDYEQVIRPIKLEKEGYSFSGWESNLNEGAVPNTMPSQNIELYGSLTINKHTITFKTTGDNEIDSIYQDYGTEIIKPEAPLRKGYTFIGWDKEIPETMPDKDMTIYACWHLNNYLLSFGNLESGYSSINVPYGSNIKEILDSYFTSWDLIDPSKYPATPHNYENSKTYIYSFSEPGVNKIKIKFSSSTMLETDKDYMGIFDEYERLIGVYTGSSLAGKTIEIIGDSFLIKVITDASVTKYGFSFESIYVDRDGNTSPQKEGYTFTGWDKELPETMPDENILINARWIANNYKIRFDMDELEEIDPLTQAYNSVVNLPTPEKDHYDLIGWDWYDNSGKKIGSNLIRMPSQDCTVKPRWQLKKYTLSFNTNGGNTIPPITDYYGTNIDNKFTQIININRYPYPETPHNYSNNETYNYNFSYPNASRLVLTFSPSTLFENNCDYLYLYDGLDNQVGAYTGTSLAGKSIEIVGNSFSIKVTTDGSVTKYGFSLDSIRALGRDSFAPIKTGYLFTGWSPELPETIPGENITYTANWEIGTYTISFNTNGGNKISPITQNYQTEITVPDNPAKEGYTFVGWDKEIPAYMPGEDITFNAKWDLNNYTITYKTYDGSTFSKYNSRSFNYGSSIYEASSPYRSGYTFKGWLWPTEAGIMPETMPAYNMTVYALWAPNNACPEGHDIKIIDTEVPTCSENGYSGDIFCPICKKIFAYGYVLPAYGHDYASIITKSATCTEEGNKLNVCNKCGAYTEETIAPTGHSALSSEVTFQPTCTEKGINTLTCHCGYIWTEEISENGHSLDNIRTIKKATCEETGILRYTCSVCGFYQDEEIKTLEHTIVEVNTRIATCTEDGNTYGKYCSKCNKIYEQSELIPALGHNFENIIIKEPTCSERGEYIHRCDRCGMIESEDGKSVYQDFVIDSSRYPQTSHNYSNNMNKTYDFTYEGATRLVLKFSSNTYFESGYDYLYLFDSNGNLYGSYTGSSLSNRTITLEGDRFSIRVTTDGSVTKYGFSFDSITAVTFVNAKIYSVPAVGHVYEDITLREATCQVTGEYAKRCNRCGVYEASNIPVYEEKLADKWTYPESDHNYLANQTYSYSYVYPKAEYLKLKFSKDCMFESNYDYLYLYDKTGNLIGTYTGTELQNKEVTIQGDTVNIKLISDDTVNHYGFKLDSITVNADISIKKYTKAKTDHKYRDVVAKPANPTQEGQLTRICDYCGYSYNDVIPKTLYAVGEIISYGSYPQGRVIDEATIEALNNLSVTWNSYKYYSGNGSASNGSMIDSDFMLYADVSYNGNKYRAVTFSTYRPNNTGFVSSDLGTYSNQDENGFYKNKVYWFRYEPIQWRILDPTSGLVVCETVIDAQPYNNYVSGSYGNNSYYANNYEQSSIRKWLNEDFYNTAFSNTQKANILSTELINKSSATLRGDTKSSVYDCSSTTDKVFLLSYEDVLNNDYSFSRSTSDSNTRAVYKGTDYARCQGLDHNTYGNCSWYLRTPATSGNTVLSVLGDGSISTSGSVGITSRGIRPAVRLLNVSTFVDEPDSANAYTVTYELSGKALTTLTYTPGDPIVLLSTSPNSGAVFSGWNEPDEMPAENIVLKGEYLPVYTATFKVDGKVIEEVQYTTATTAIIEPEIPQKEGYTAQWEDYKFIAGGITVNAIYTLDGDHTHEFVSSITKQPTCVNNGVKTYKCNICDYEYTESIIAAGHSFTEYVYNNDATTEKDGTETQICSVCSAKGKTRVKEGTKLPNEHTHSYTSTVTKQPTCTVDGFLAFTCSCGDIFEGVIPATGHTDKNKDGYCDVCKTVVDASLINPCKNAKISVATAKIVDYKSIVTIKATATGVPSNYYLAIYVNGKQVAKGTNTEVIYEVGQLTSDVNYIVKVVDSNGVVQKDANNKELTKDSKVTVNTSFFKKLIAFFKGLFGMLPTVTIKP